jgi:hypothetical protein
MNTLRFIGLCIFLLAVRCPAQLPVAGSLATYSGAFYVAVDDEATIYVNGMECYHAKIGESRSPETELKVGDRVVVQLWNKGGPRHFLFVFVASDGKTTFSFKHHQFKIIRDIGVTDFKPEDLAKWPTAKEERQKKAAKLPIHNFSEFIWGDLDTCTIATVVSPEMIYQKP